MTDVYGISISGRSRSLLVLGGSCVGCSLKAVNPETFKNTQYGQVIIVYLASARTIRWELPSPAAKVRIVADPEGRIVQSLRAYAAPRFYLVEGGDLVSIWKDTEKWPFSWTGEKSK